MAVVVRVLSEFTVSLCKEECRKRPMGAGVRCGRLHRLASRLFPTSCERHPCALPALVPAGFWHGLPVSPGLQAMPACCVSPALCPHRQAPRSAGRGSLHYFPLLLEHGQPLGSPARTLTPVPGGVRDVPPTPALLCAQQAPAGQLLGGKLLEKHGESLEMAPTSLCLFSAGKQHLHRAPCSGV